MSLIITQMTRAQSTLIGSAVPECGCCQHRVASKLQDIVGWPEIAAGSPLHEAPAASADSWTNTRRSVWFYCGRVPAPSAQGGSPNPPPSISRYLLHTAIKHHNGFYSTRGRPNFRFGFGAECG